MNECSRKASEMEAFLLHERMRLGRRRWEVVPVRVPSYPPVDGIRAVAVLAVVADVAATVVTGATARIVRVCIITPEVDVRPVRAEHAAEISHVPEAEAPHGKPVPF